MSFTDKSDNISKEEWQTRLENFKFKQADMNKLIMNYLVTGQHYFANIFFCCLQTFIVVFFFFGVWVKKN